MPSYRPDPAHAWIAAVRPGAALLASASAVDEVRAAWPDLAGPDPIGRVLARLTAHGFGALPDFALIAVGEGTARVLVRGPVRVRAAEVLVDGRDVTTWTERVLDLPAGTTLSVRTSESDGAPLLPLEDGIVFADRLDLVEVASAGDPGPASAAAPRSAGPVQEPPAFAPGIHTLPEHTAVVTDPTRTTVPDRAPGTGETTIGGADAAPPRRAAEETMVPLEDTVLGIAAPVPQLASASAPHPAGASGPSTGPAATASVSVPTAHPSTIRADAAASSVAAAPPAPSGQGTPLGDHDGLTVTGVDLDRLRAGRRAAPEPATAGLHAAPEPSANGRGAGSEPARDAASVRLKLPNGVVETLDGAAVVGRSPSAAGLAGGRLPKLITLGAGDADISRSHVRFALEGGTVVVTDLQSRNGTLVVAPGRPPVRLRGGEPTPVLVGTVVDLGGGWTIQVVGP